MNKTGDSLILLSAGLDSLVSLGLKKDELNITTALTFDYGQKAATKETAGAKKICEYYGLEHHVIKLDWLKEITKTSLVSDEQIPFDEMSEDSAKSVWVPNRNGLFLNIAGCFADSEGFKNIIIGANREEGETFPDNTPEFIGAVNAEFEYSTRVKPKVVAPLINYVKNDIVMLALKSNIPLELTMSCYSNEEKHCGKCESCHRLKNALKTNGAEKYIKILFE